LFRRGAAAPEKSQPLAILDSNDALGFQIVKSTRTRRRAGPLRAGGNQDYQQ
jgi:hypothetical protein